MGHIFFNFSFISITCDLLMLKLHTLVKTIRKIRDFPALYSECTWFYAQKRDRDTTGVTQRSHWLHFGKLEEHAEYGESYHRNKSK